jgi:hypothetical protein
MLQRCKEKEGIKLKVERCTGENSIKLMPKCPQYQLNKKPGYLLSVTTARMGFMESGKGLEQLLWQM